MLPPPENDGSRRPFRQRLLLTLGPALALALVLLGMLVWVIVYGLLTYNAQVALEIEIQEIATQVLTGQGTLNINAYTWNEPHHRFQSRHIDPYFVQVFDAQARPLFASDNIRLLAPEAYPARLLAYQTTEDQLIQRLRTFDVGGNLLYYRTEPLYNAAGTLLGYIQVARYEPGIAALMQRTALFLLLGFTPVLLGLLALVWWSARRVVAPLEAITAEARTISPHHLNQRITIPPRADQETTELATTLNAQLTRLEASFEEMRRFTADAAHELQTPLTVLLGHVEIALRRERSPEAYQETLTVLHHEISDLIRLVRSLLQLARLDREDQPLPTEPVDLVTVLRHDATHFRQVAETKGLSFSLTLPDAAWIDAEPHLMHEVVINLLDNAVKYTEQGSIHVSVYEDERAVTLAVEDTGVGMPEEVRRHVTERFYRAPTMDARGIPGSGLGLSLIAQIVAKHHGRITLTSAPNQGTTVRVVFPAAVQETMPPL